MLLPFIFELWGCRGQVWGSLDALPVVVGALDVFLVGNIGERDCVLLSGPNQNYQMPQECQLSEPGQVSRSVERVNENANPRMTS